MFYEDMMFKSIVNIYVKSILLDDYSCDSSHERICIIVNGIVG